MYLLLESNGFQAKYFVDRIGYSQIAGSARKTIKYYAGKVDKIYLYCNKDLYIGGVQYQRIKALLNNNGIEIETVTNRAILDVVPDYPQIASCYFNTFALTPEWFETKLEHKYLHIRFLCDGIIKYKNEYYILEIKTETSVKWQSRREINEEHIEQGVAYSTLLHIDNVLFLYENRDFCDWKSFILNVSDTMKMEYILNPINSCERYIKSNKVPPIPAVAGTKYCRYCLYKNACKVIGQTEDISNQHEEHLND